MPTGFEHRCRFCQGLRTPPIEGPCPHCHRYYRTTEKRIRDESEREAMPLQEGPVPVGELLDHYEPSDWEKRPTGQAGVDHVFGGGLPRVGVVLLCAIEGIGKTSWLFELLMSVRHRSLFLSTEQSKEDLIRQFSRFGPDRLRKASKHMSVESSTELDDILDIITDYKPELMVLDSLHEIEGITDEHGNPMASGGDRAVTRVARLFQRLARDLGFFSFLVGHMSNDGTMMGGSHLRHAVEGVLGMYPMSDDEKDTRRILRFKRKARFAPIGREALFRMTDNGFRDCGPLLDAKKNPDPAPSVGRLGVKRRIVN